MAETSADRRGEWWDAFFYEVKEQPDELALLNELIDAQKKADNEWKEAFDEEHKGREEVDAKEYKIKLAQVRIKINPEDSNRDESDPTCSNICHPIETASRPFNCFVVGAKVLLILSNRILILNYNNLKAPPLKEIFVTELHPKAQCFSTARKAYLDGP